MKIFIKKTHLLQFLLSYMLLISPIGYAESIESLSKYSSAKEEKKSQVVQKLMKMFPSLKDIDLQESEVEGFYQFWSGSELVHVFPQGEHLMVGELFDASRSISLSEQAREKKLKKLMADLDESNMIIYSAKQPKREITVFTDVDCFFCRKLHREINILTNAGVTVRYLAFPVFSQDMSKHMSVWCSDEPQITMTRAKNGQKIKRKVCKNNIKSSLQLGIDLGFKGTPQVVYDNGKETNYVSAKQIIENLKLNSSLEK